LCDVNGLPSPANVAYDLVDPGIVDGLVSWASSVGRAMEHDQIVDFHRRYHPLPVVSIALPMERIPAVSVDSYRGMRDVITHLVEVHGYRRLAFIRGPETHYYAQERYRAYVDALDAYGIPLDPNLVTPPRAFDSSTGVKGIKLLLDERKLRPQVDFEAVVTVTDLFALPALEELQARGLQVPNDVALAGFNDAVEGRFVTPPLTSVRLPFYEQGRKAVETLLAVLAGESVPDEVPLPSEMVVRRSCGCKSAAVLRASTGLTPDSSSVQAGRDETLAGMTQAVATFENLDAMWIEQLVDGFIAELGEESTGDFLGILDDVLFQVAAVVDNVAVMQDVLSVLRRDMLPYLSGTSLSRAQDLLQQARVMVAEVSERTRAYQVLQVERQAELLRDVSQSLLTTFDVGELMDAVVSELPRLDIPSAYLSLYENPFKPAEWSRLMLAYSMEGRAELDAGGVRFPSPKLMPEGMWPQGQQYSFVVTPLHFQDAQLGFILCEAGPRGGLVYEVLSTQIGNALQGALLLQGRKEAEAALGQAYAEVERQVAERTAELEQAQEESLLLQQEVIDAQQQALQQLSAPIIPVLEGVIVMPLIGTIDSLRARGITRSLLGGIREHRARVIILDITGVPIVDSGVAAYLNKTIQAARLKGARTIVTGVSDAVAETIVDLGIDWSGVETLGDLQTGLRIALQRRGPAEIGS
jgi:DNA-binding LacI/PurR family transcriptional regulator/anti-anti-sigma regulatory factor